MKIVQLAAEFAPIAKAGGLGEVLVGLSRELSRPAKVDVIIPKYDFIEMKNLRFVKREGADFKCMEFSNAMWSASSEGCDLHLLEARHPAGYFHRGKIYGCEDDVPRFIYFCRAALEYLKTKNEPIDILHLHDWHTSLCAPLVRDLFAKELKVKKIVLTVHNAEYQGKCATSDLDAIGLNGKTYLTKEKLQDDHPSYPETINLLKGGIVYADAVVAVSPTYAKEIVTSEFGFHLDSTFRKYQGKLSGILNGIDTKIWDPANDPHLPSPYASDSSPTTIIAAKKAAKEALKKRFSLNGKEPWIGAVTRLVPQKGPELLAEGIRHTLTSGGTFILLGSSPILSLQSYFEKLKTEYASNSELLLQLSYDDALAHQIYAALDFLLVPSHYEPCGLTQLIAMRYGTIPIVHATGGLKDTVFDYSNLKIAASERNGFTFPFPTTASMNGAIDRGFTLFRGDPTAFQSLLRRTIQRSYSWQEPAQQYMTLYKKLLGS